MRFTVRAALPVRAPYRLDLTADALRRLAANVVDVIDADGVYRRALSDDRGVNVVAVRQRTDDELDVRISGANGRRWLPVLERMLGTQVALESFYRRTRAVPWLDRVARELRGLKPPRYPDLWEALCNAIVFQQISIHAAGSIMRRTIEALGEPVEGGDGLLLFPFPRPSALLRASDAELRAAGLSGNKIAHLRSVAEVIATRTVTDAMIEASSTSEASNILCSVRGIGPWSAAVVLLRGFGRLDTFPMGDSGVARSIRLLTGDPNAQVDGVLEALGPTRGMLYFHLLLGRLRNLVPTPSNP
ncbi:MAG: DNA-3-methyladenine glycosylase family protein [Vulcanimicrobiaceae bacterium]